MSWRGSQTAKRAAVEGLGWLLVVVGVAALVLPGPGLLALFAGLALLSQRYTWAARRVEPVKRRAFGAAAQSVATPVRVALSALGVLVLLGCGVLWIWAPPVPAWWPLPAWSWLPGGLWTGVTQVVSAAMVATLIVYSYRKFRGEPEVVAPLER